MGTKILGAGMSDWATTALAIVSLFEELNSDQRLATLLKLSEVLFDNKLDKVVDDMINDLEQ